MTINFQNDQSSNHCFLLDEGSTTSLGKPASILRLASLWPRHRAPEERREEEDSGGEPPGAIASVHPRPSSLRGPLDHESRDRLHSVFSVNDWAHGPIAGRPIEASLRRGGATRKGGKRRARRKQRGLSTARNVGARAVSWPLRAQTRLGIPSEDTSKRSTSPSFPFARSLSLVLHRVFSSLTVDRSCVRDPRTRGISRFAIATLGPHLRVPILDPREKVDEWRNLFSILPIKGTDATITLRCNQW